MNARRLDSDGRIDYIQPEGLGQGSYSVNTLEHAWAKHCNEVIRELDFVENPRYDTGCYVWQWLRDKSAIKGYIN